MCLIIAQCVQSSLIDSSLFNQQIVCLVVPHSKSLRVALLAICNQFAFSVFSLPDMLLQLKTSKKEEEKKEKKHASTIPPKNFQT